MEAIAKFPFRATADDELSFEKGSIVKVKYNATGAAVWRKFMNTTVCWWLAFPINLIHNLGVKYGNRSELVQSRAKWSRWIHTKKLHRDETTRVSIDSEIVDFQTISYSRFRMFDNMAVELRISLTWNNRYNHTIWAGSVFWKKKKGDV